MPRAYKLRRQVSDTTADGPDAPYRDLLYRLGVVIFRADEDGRWTFLSSAWPELSGYSIDESIGVPARLYVHDSDLRKSSRMLGNMQRAPGVHFRETLRLRRADGRLCRVEAQARLDLGAQGMPATICGFLTDLSRLKPARERVQPGGETHATQPRALDILLVEDQPVTQKLMSLLLEKRGHHVTLAGDGQSALRHFMQEKFDLVLMDLQLPVMDSLAATQAMRAYEARAARAHTPIVAMTAQTASGDRDMCMQAGMDDYLAKPVVTAALERVLREHCLPRP